jgi:hypothetical protein
MSEQIQTTEVTQPVATEQNTTPATATTTPAQPTSQPATQAPSWKTSISEEYRTNPNIEKFTEIDALAKSYINAVSMIGSDKIPLPGKTATEEQWNEVYNKLGRPVSPDKYALELKTEAAQVDPNAIKGFAENAHKLGLNNKQAQGILEFYKSTLEQSAKDQSITMETAQANATNILRQEWGRNYDANLNKASAIAKQYLEPQILDTQLRDGTRLGDNPAIIKAFANIANILSEDRILGTENSGVNQIRDIELEIGQITSDKNSAYWNKSNPLHTKVVSQVLALRELLHAQKQ